MLFVNYNKNCLKLPHIFHINIVNYRYLSLKVLTIDK